jgi:hypothetical protein
MYKAILDSVDRIMIGVEEMSSKQHVSLRLPASNINQDAPIVNPLSKKPSAPNLVFSWPDLPKSLTGMQNRSGE